MTPARARWLTIRAHLAFAWWLGIGVLFVGLAVGIVVQVTLGVPHTPPATLLLVPPILWIAAWLVLTFGTVWWYRRGFAASVAADDLAARERAYRLTQVRPVFVLRSLAGVDTAGLPRTRVARFLDSWRPLVLHLTAIGCLLLGALAIR
ncbi:hypothetical protein [Agrococcus sp. SGAir0287]|uniref:hypothetical protein n=1 Tax=Agrococcus sp. SGAir0287 TaxID=2070347 RepID=UPI0010CCC99E|nr:hypothetical protein [Agrococcus sp. SGAir0287]QCR18714.1 hypothetical protein C1N71_03980 [Agrococcus sp. SGAir0287]